MTDTSTTSANAQQGGPALSRRTLLGTVAAVAATGLIGRQAAAAPAATGPAPKLALIPGNSDAVKGTWVLQQTLNETELNNLLAGQLGLALDENNIVGFSHRVPWSAVDTNFDLLDAGYDAAASRGLQYAPRFMAGRWSPARIFNSPINCPSYPRPGTGEPIPRPFTTAGAANTIFEAQWDAFVDDLESWCRGKDVRLMHLAWYGQDWAELNHGIEVRSLTGYTYARWRNAHTRLIDLALTHADADLAVEFPLSGYGPLSSNTGSPGARDLADHAEAALGGCSDIFFCQANGWGQDHGVSGIGDWGAPNIATETAFDSDVWTTTLYRGQQMIQPFDYANWDDIYGVLYTNNATYCEVYAPSFFTAGGAAQPHLSDLRAEIAAFDTYVQSATPAPPTC
jgi:hypothetical protein